MQSTNSPTPTARHVELSISTLDTVCDYLRFARDQKVNVDGILSAPVSADIPIFTMYSLFRYTVVYSLSHDELLGTSQRGYF